MQDFPNQIQESPHEHQQGLLLSRIITNVVGLFLFKVIFLHSIEFAFVGKAQRGRHGIEQKSPGLFFTAANATVDWYVALMQVPRTHQEISIQNMNVELVAQMFKNYRSNVLFHLEGKASLRYLSVVAEDR